MLLVTITWRNGVTQKKMGIQKQMSLAMVNQHVNECSMNQFIWQVLCTESYKVLFDTQPGRVFLCNYEVSPYMCSKSKAKKVLHIVTDVSDEMHGALHISLTYIHIQIKCMMWCNNWAQLRCVCFKAFH